MISLHLPALKQLPPQENQLLNNDSLTKQFTFPHHILLLLLISYLFYYFNGSTNFPLHSLKLGFGCGSTFSPHQESCCCPVESRDAPRNVDSPDNLSAFAGVTGQPALCLTIQFIVQGFGLFGAAEHTHLECLPMNYMGMSRSRSRELQKSSCNTLVCASRPDVGVVSPVIAHVNNSLRVEHVGSDIRSLHLVLAAAAGAAAAASAQAGHH